MNITLGEDPITTYTAKEPGYVLSLWEWVSNDEDFGTKSYGRMAIVAAVPIGLFLIIKKLRKK